MVAVLKLKALIHTPCTALIDPHSPKMKIFNFEVEEDTSIFT